MGKKKTATCIVENLTIVDILLSMRDLQVCVTIF